MMINPSSSTLPRMALRIGGLAILLVALGSSQAWGQLLNNFQPNTPARASEVNQNFQILLGILTKDPLIDTTDAISSTAGRGPDGGHGNLITVDRDITVTGFSFQIELNADPGDLKFFIFETTDPIPLWVGSPQAFPLDSGAPTWKRSEDMCLVLEAGKSYRFGAIGNVNTQWPYEFVANVANGITAASQNQNFGNFASPEYQNNGSVNFWQRIYGISGYTGTCP